MTVKILTLVPLSHTAALVLRRMSIGLGLDMHVWDRLEVGTPCRCCETPVPYTTDALTAHVKETPQAVGVALQETDHD